MTAPAARARLTKTRSVPHASRTQRTAGHASAHLRASQFVAHGRIVTLSPLAVSLLPALDELIATRKNSFEAYLSELSVGNNLRVFMSLFRMLAIMSETSGVREAATRFYALTIRRQHLLLLSMLNARGNAVAWAFHALLSKAVTQPLSPSVLPTHPIDKPVRLSSRVRMMPLALALRGDLSLFKHLLAFEHDVHKDLGDGLTLLHLAALGGQARDPAGQIRCLLQAGANPHAKDDKGATALHYAAGGTVPETVALLLQAGVKPGCRDRDGWTPLNYCRLKGENHPEILALLCVPKLTRALTPSAPAPARRRL